jgi:hypothetical protein
MARKPPVVSHELRVSQRVTLRTGDKFRAKGGPYWKTKDGVRVSLASRGPYTFHRHCAQGNYEWIESLDRDGAFAPLHIAGKRRRVDPRIVPRPYVVTGKKRTTAKA